ncbi:MAG: hypothetical protein ACRCXB_17920 [Aeromonadaceae bacterium]
MLNYKPDLVALLKGNSADLQVYYQDFIDEPATVPCISYRQLGDETNIKCPSKEYGVLRFAIQVWGRNWGEVENVSDDVDLLMDSQGFTRYGTAESSLPNGHKVKVMSYEAEYQRYREVK